MFRYFSSLIVAIRSGVSVILLLMHLLLHSSCHMLKFSMLVLSCQLKDHNGGVKQTAVFYSGNLKYFGPEHLPYAVVMFLTFNIVPLVLLTLYPCHCFQLCLNRCWKGSGFHNVMDDFFKCYKTSPRDCRLFGVVYLYLRLFNLSLLLVALSPGYLNLVSLLYLIMAMLIALVQPHQVHIDTRSSMLHFFHNSSYRDS